MTCFWASTLCTSTFPGAGKCYQHPFSRKMEICSPDLHCCSLPSMSCKGWRGMCMGKGAVCVGRRKVYVRHSSEHGLGSDGAEGEALKVGHPRSSSYINSYVFSYHEHKSCYVWSVPFVLLVPSSFELSSSGNSRCYKTCYSLHMILHLCFLFFFDSLP